MDLLIDKQQWVDITSTKDLSNYHLQFIAITTWLISKGQLGDLEQQRAYIRTFQPSLLNVIMNWLQLKKPNHHPNVPHKVEKVYKAARFVLQGYTSFTQNLIASTSPQQLHLLLPAQLIPQTLQLKQRTLALCLPGSQSQS